MKTYILSLIAALLALITQSHGVNIAPLGSGLLGSNDTTIGDAGFGHFNAGVLASIRDGNLTTRVDNFQTNQAARVNGFVGISWATARAEAIKSLSLTMATFPDGGWFGNLETPTYGHALTAPMLVAPVVQVSTDLVTWTTVPSTMNYVSAFTGHIIADSSVPTSATFNITLPLAQTGLRGIRVIGPSGGWGDGNGFIGVFEMGVEADVLTDTDSDGMHDPWETANGLTVGVNDAALDAEGDGLSNVLEFRWNSNPQLADSDGDTLSDGAEHTTHGTFPNAADTDGDGLSDSAEINTHLTSAKLTDTDGDGLSDNAELNTHLTLPLNRDTDGDGFSDGAEISLATNPLSAASRIANIARGGTAVMGTATNTPRTTPGTTTSLNDGSLLTHALTNSSTSYAGVQWSAVWPQPVARMEVELATFPNGGWFGSTGANPLPGDVLTAAHITGAPALQTTTDGVNWVAVPVGNYATDYVTRLIGHNIGGGGQIEATRRSAVFTFNTPIAGLRGIRVHGATRTFLGVYEVTVCDSTTAADTDGDGLTNANEVLAGTDAAHQDTDGDAALDGAEVNTLLTNPLLADTDADYFPDGLEVARGTNPLLEASNPGNLSLVGGGIIGVGNSGYPTIPPGNAGTPITNAGTMGNIVDGDIITRVDSYNGSDTLNPYNFIGARWGKPVKASAVKVQFAIFNHAGWFGPSGVGPAAGGALTAAHLLEPIVQTTHDGGISWQQVPATSDYIAALTGQVIAGADNRPTRTPVVTFTLTTPATGITGIRVIGREGGVSQPFVGVFDFTVVPSSVVPETAVTIPWVTVGNPGNAPHSNGRGAVGYVYQISTHEVTIAQYCAFLNAVAASDPNGLYNPSMATSAQVCGILREGTSGSFVYHVIGDGRRPITFVGWLDAARFMNWLVNGQGTGSTESGAYNLAQPSNLTVGQVRQAGAVFALPSSDEWFKAAHYDPAKSGGSGGYWNYATRADALVNNSVSANYVDAQGDWGATQTLATNTPTTSLLLPVGHYAGAPSAYGTFDQTGSVWEWVEQDLGAVRYQFGGSWFETAGAPDANAMPSQRTATDELSITGFRVVNCPPAPPLFGSPGASGKVSAYAGGADGGTSATPGPGFVPDNSISFLADHASFGGAGLISASKFYSNGNPAYPINNSATGTVALGKISLNAANKSPGDTQYYAGISAGGWEDTLVVSAPGQLGDTAYLLINFHVEAHLHAHPPSGSSSFSFAISTDGPAIIGNEPAVFSGSSTGSYPQFKWAHRNYPDASEPLIKDVNETITVSVPVVVGQQIRFRAYGVSRGSLASVGAYGASSIGIVNAKIKSTGYQGLITQLGAPIPGFTVQAASQTNYSGALPPHFIATPSVITSAGGNFQITWPSLVGQNYILEKSSDLVNWVPIAVPGALGETIYQHTPAPGETKQFFRTTWEF